jgi:hypothetical protein
MWEVASTNSQQRIGISPLSRNVKYVRRGWILIISHTLLPSLYDCTIYQEGWLQNANRLVWRIITTTTDMRIVEAHLQNQEQENTEPLWGGP